MPSTSSLAPSPSAPTLLSALLALPEPRLFDLCRLLGCDVRGERGRELLSRRLAEHLGALPALLRELGRDELRLVCRRHGIDAGRASRLELMAAILEAAGIDKRVLTTPPPAARIDGLPQKGQVVHARHRQWLVEGVEPGEPGDSPLVRLVCIDDDDPGRQLEVLWDLELGAHAVVPEAQGLGALDKIDPPTHFGAYLHALAWSAVSAADATRFQAPFRAGIKLMAHQLTPLMKALELPRANLFIADDVGLGKTIEAGLVMQELILRQQASFVLVACPASVCLQWQGEMQRRFGLRFEVMTRKLVAYKRQERGYGINPWSTHNRFIVSHSLLRRPEYRDTLLAHLGERVRRGLFVLDEAHAAAPASASKWAVDTEITRTVRDLAPRFDNRLFLSATPHNGHSNSFSALLELLDPVRFMRGDTIEGKKDLAPVMVRRLKRDLRAIGVAGERFPRRLLVELALRHEAEPGGDGRWSVAHTSYDAETGEATSAPAASLGAGLPLELDLADKLARYTELCAPGSGQGRLPFIHLQQRLLSSPEAFARSFEAHARGVERRGGPQVAKAQLQTKLELDVDPETHGESDEALAEASLAELERQSLALPSPTEEARTLLTDLGKLAERARRAPDAKMRALLAWMREHLCPAIGLGPEAQLSRAWSDRRVILFTEYADTKTWVVDLLRQAALHTELGDQRILQFHGGMGDEARDEVQRAFNAEPSQNPARILVATDAAREGVNLQAHCADLFHLDIPWNPSRLEQRNGRIDRTLQPAEEVRCHYFLLPQRSEDRVLETVVRKVATVQRELGSLGTVLLAQVESALEAGLTAKAAERVAAIGEGAARAQVEDELEAHRKDLDALRAEVVLAGKRLDASAKALQVAPEALRGVVSIGLALAGGPGASPAELTPSQPTSDGRPTYLLPKLDPSWDRTLDTLRPARGRTEPFWEWRKKPPRAVCFHPLTRLSEEAEQLHLAHPLVRRILDRFLAQGFGAHDLSRVTAFVAEGESVIRVVAYGRLTLFGPGAARLHDELVPMAADWNGDATPVTPHRERTLASTVAKIQAGLARGARAPGEAICARIREHASGLYASLWPHVEAAGEALAVEARRGLAGRARRESEALRALLERQLANTDRVEARLRQVELFQVADKDQKRQVEADLRHLEERRRSAARELETEPRAIEQLYEVSMTRLSPVGLVVAWPEALT
mgnify:CR=1 FL=1